MRFLLALCLMAPALAFGSVESDWAAIVALDAGPGGKPRTREEAVQLARTHFALQTRRIEEFLARYPDDPRVFDARLRLAALLAATGKMEERQQPVDEAMRILTELEKSRNATPQQRANAGFRRVSLYLQSMRGREVEMRGAMVDAARNFAFRYPGDKRGPRLLVEVASLCDSDPGLKRALLEEASGSTSEPALQRRIADDLLRLSLLDKPLRIAFRATDGRIFDSASEKGNIVVVVFWSAESPHCLLWWPAFKRLLAESPRAGVRLATVALDTNSSEALSRLKEFGFEGTPTHCDGRGWQNAVARPLGINSLPTVFVIDRKGVLRSLNARDNIDLWLRRLSRE